jgi:hypothetical protein
VAKSIEFLELLNSGKQSEALEQLQERGWLERKESSWKVSREASEFATKLKKLGVALPW